MKRCNRCGQTKPFADFHVHRTRADGLQVYCKACRSEIDHERYERIIGGPAPRYPRLPGRVSNRGWILSLKAGLPCTDCGRTYPLAVMQWDHLPGRVKVADVSAMALYTREEILAEIAKCELVCTNCHTIRTGMRGGWADGKLLREAAGRYGLAPTTTWLS